MRVNNLRDARLMGWQKLIDEFTLAGDAYEVGNYNKELFHMIRAEAMRDALDIPWDVYENLKRMVELKYGLKEEYVHFIAGEFEELMVKVNGGV